MNSPTLSPTMRRIFLEAVVLWVLATAVGLSLNFQVVFNAFSGKSVSHSEIVGTIDPAGGANDEAMPQFPVPVELPEIDALLEDGAVLVDARSVEDYRLAHLAGAVSLPFGDLQGGFEEFKQHYPLDSILILYCSGYGCSDSFDLGVRLLKEGYRDVMVYEGGFPEWRDAGKPLEGDAI